MITKTQLISELYATIIGANDELELELCHSVIEYFNNNVIEYFIET